MLPFVPGYHRGRICVDLVEGHVGLVPLVSFCIFAQYELDEACQNFYLGCGVVAKSLMLTEEGPHPFGGVKVGQQHLCCHLRWKDMSSADMECSQSVTYFTLHSERRGVALTADTCV